MASRWLPPPQRTLLQATDGVELKQVAPASVNLGVLGGLLLGQLGGLSGSHLGVPGLCMRKAASSLSQERANIR